jgi:sarcosine reductase
VYLAKTTKGLKADEVEVFDLKRPQGNLAGLPKVAYLMQLHSHGETREPFVYGVNSRNYYPTILHPNEILDGAIVCGHYNISPAFRNDTYTLLNHPVICGLFRRHGTELDFRGVVISPEPTSLTEIARTSMMASGLLKDALQADGVVVTKEGGGHTDVDLMENCDLCEQLGIRAVLIDNEWLGPDGAGEFPLLASSPNADAMVSVGNVDGHVKLPGMDKVIGGTRLIGGFNQDLDGKITLPIWFIPNAVSQAGFTYLSTESR